MSEYVNDNDDDKGKDEEGPMTMINDDEKWTRAGMKMGYMPLIGRELFRKIWQILWKWTFFQKLVGGVLLFQYSQWANF